MDKRVIKTKQDIKNGFLNLLKIKNYNDITIENILKESNVARSTFYEHFKSKEDILSSLSEDIFTHITSINLEKELHHDFSSKNNFKDLLLHMFYHFYEDKEILKIIFENESRGTFLKLLHHSIIDLMNKYDKEIINDSKIPFSLSKKIIIIDLMNLIKWWIEENNFNELPPSIYNYFEIISKEYIK